MAINISSMTASVVGQYKFQELQKKASSSSLPSSGSDTATFSPESLALAIQKDSPISISDEQVAKISDAVKKKDLAVFKHLDLDHDDKLSREEIKKSLESTQIPRVEVSNSTKSDDAISKAGARLQKSDPKLFAEIDTDKSGKLGHERAQGWGGKNIGVFFSQAEALDH